MQDMSGVHREYDRVFFMGDLNMRLNEKRETVDAWIKAERFDECLKTDDLLPLLKGDSGHAGLWPDFQEAKITFPPTYKFDKKSDVYDSSKKQRDRILWKKDVAIKSLSYDWVPSLKCSDHRPVFAQFEVKVDLNCRDARSGSPRAGSASPKAKEPNEAKVPWRSHWNAKAESEKRYVRSTGSGKLGTAPISEVEGIFDHADFEDQSVRALLAARDVDDQTPLHRAARHGHLEVCDLLLRRRADVLATEGWVGRCAQLLGEQNAEKVEEAKACLARVNTGLMTDVSRVYTAFRRFDVDESNHLDDQELSRLAAYLGFDVDPMDLDHNDDGKISLTEFQDFVGRMGGVQTLFEQRRKRIAEGRRDAASFAGVAVGARVQAHYWVGVKPDRRKSEQPAEAIVMGEDAQVAEALREVGIHEEDQPFWDAVFPASEMQEAPEPWGLVGPKGPKWIPEESAT
eukprot:g19363.t1